MLLQVIGTHSLRVSSLPAMRKGRDSLTRNWTTPETLQDDTKITSLSNSSIWTKNNDNLSSRATSLPKETNKTRAFSELLPVSKPKTSQGFTDTNRFAKIIKQAEKIQPSEKNIRPMSCDQCFVRHFKYINQPSDVCGLLSPGGAPKLDMVITIPSIPSDRLKRDLLRSTWLFATRGNTAADVRHVFVLGSVSDKHEQELIDKESLKYNDIVQTSFVDCYKNLTLKTLSILDWASAHCHNAKYAFKVDDDVFTNVDNVLKVTKSPPQKDAVLGEARIKNHGPIRDTRSKWGVTRAEYPGSKYPPFVAGPRYLVPMTIIPGILEASVNTPFFHLEDVYMGLVLDKTKYAIAYSTELLRRGKLSANCKDIKNISTAHGLKSGPKLSEIWKRCYKDVENATKSRR